MPTLKELADAILFTPQQPEAYAALVQELQDLFAACTGVKPFHLTIQEEFLPSGNVLSPLYAAHCVLDVQRTVVFLRGVYKAIKAQQAAFPGQRVNILYAGCGPYATLVTPLTAYFSPEEVGFYVLDYFQESLDSVHSLYAALDGAAYLNALICADATEYTMPAGGMMHIVVSETMQMGLIEEPQVAIMQRLIPQMSDAAVFVPEEISIDLQLMDKALAFTGEWNTPGDRKPDYMVGTSGTHMGRVYTISKESYTGQPPFTVQLPEDVAGKSLGLFTTIKVWGDEVLQPHSCIIARPMKIADVAGRGGHTLQLRYRQGNHPGFELLWPGDEAAV